MSSNWIPFPQGLGLNFHKEIVETTTYSCISWTWFDQLIKVVSEEFGVVSTPTIPNKYPLRICSWIMEVIDIYAFLGDNQLQQKSSIVDCNGLIGTCTKLHQWCHHLMPGHPYPMTDPWDWYIYLLIYHKNQPNVVNIPFQWILWLLGSLFDFDSQINNK